MSEIPKVIKNFNLIIDGRGFAGLVDAVSLPELALVIEEHRAGGMDGPIPLEFGQEMMEMSFTSAEHNVNILKLWGLQNQNAVSLTFRAAMVNDLVVHPYLLKVTGMITTIAGGDIENGQKMPMEVTMNLRFYSLLINGEEIHYIDLVNMIRRIGGKDQLQLQREALGL